jgi:hypothetical protein
VNAKALNGDSVGGDSLNRDPSHRDSVEHFGGSTVQQFDESTTAAWQPFTPRGLAAFANASFGRLFLLLCTIALISAGTVVWFLNTAWYPAIRAAIHELPAQGQIVRQELHTPRTSATPLAEHHFLGFVIIVPPATDADLNSHIAVKFRARAMDVCSIFGYWRMPYPPGWTFDFNRTDLEPGWGAWQPIVTAIAAMVTFLGLLMTWFALGVLYSLVPWVAAWLTKRKLSWIGSWRMCTAGLVPGALLMVAAIWLYGFGVLDLLQFLVLVVLHFVLPWLCIGLAVRALPSTVPRILSGGNPFTAAHSGAPLKSTTPKASDTLPERTALP